MINNQIIKVYTVSQKNDNDVAHSIVRRGGITNYHLIAYSFSNISAKNYQNRSMCIEVIVSNVTVVF